MRILLIGGDEGEALSLQKVLEKEKFLCDIAESGQDGVEVGKLYDYDLIILDLVLPDMEGFDVMRRLRSSQVKTPILILSGVDGISQKVKGLTLGADDYLTKPYRKEELLARINAIIRRTHGYSESIIRIGEIEVNLRNRVAMVCGQILKLTGKEYDVLELMALRIGVVLDREAFLNHLYGGRDEPEIKIVDVFICKLRKKISEIAKNSDYIETMWGRGYMLKAPDERSQYISEVPKEVGQKEKQTA